MEEIKIGHLAYLLKQAKEKKQSQPIFFLGAGASRSGNIPLASEIIKHILNNYSESPFVQDLPKESRTYAKLMKCLLPTQRDELLKKYVDEANINVTHIYLAQLVKENFVDYILTVNFDNLMLRALALYNIYPATYDMAILKDLTTRKFKEQSVVYLHGQSHGLWLLNTPEEMDKVKTIVPRIFDTIKDNRPWIFIGYSGEDPIFEHIKNLGRFDNGFFWVTYNDNNPNENVQNFLSAPNTNAFLLKGYDSDSFFIKLNSELGLGQPSIVDKPFTALKEMLNGIVDIDDTDSFKGVKERLEIAKRQVEETIQQYELGNLESETELKENSEIDLLKKRIINLIISEKYQEEVISALEVKVKEIPNNNLQTLLSNLYYNWGTDLGNLAKIKEEKEAEKLYNQSFEKYQKAIEIKPNFHEAYNNWGSNLGDLAIKKEGKEAEELYQLSFEKLQKAVEIKPNFHEAYHNWGTDLGSLAKTKEGKKAEELFLKSFEKYQKAIEIKPNFHDAYNSWGIGLGNLAMIKEGKKAEELFLESFEKYQKAIEIKPNKHEAYKNWGSDLTNFAMTKGGKEALYNQSFEKYQKAIEIKPDKHDAYFNWGTSLGILAMTKEEKEAETLFLESFEKYQKAVEIKPDLHEAYCNWGTYLGNLAKSKEGKEAEALYHQSFEKFQKAIEVKPDFHEAYHNWGTYLGNLAMIKEGKEAEELFLKSFEKYQKAIEIKPDFHKAYNNWGSSLEDLAQTKKGKEAEELYHQSFEKYQKAIELGGKCYNLACLYAIKGNKKDALFYLDLSLKKKEILVSFIQNDKDWTIFLEDIDFINILNKYIKSKHESITD